VKVWNVSTGDCISVMKGHTDDVNSVCYSPDGKSILSASRDCSVKVWDALAGSLKKIL
jgi:WD40 repeat protein